MLEGEDERFGEPEDERFGVPRSEPAVGDGAGVTSSADLCRHITLAEYAAPASSGIVMSIPVSYDEEEAEAAEGQKKKNVRERKRIYEKNNKTKVSE